MDAWIFASFAALGAVCGVLALLILNRMPAKCFCDYDEIPDERHIPPRAGKWHGIICTAVLAAVFALIVDRFGVTVSGLALCFFSTVLAMIALSDMKFCIIPDELIIAGCLFAVIGALPGVQVVDLRPGVHRHLHGHLPHVVQSTGFDVGDD